MEVSDQIHAPAALTLGKSPLFPLNRRLDGPQSRSGCDGKERKSFHWPCRESNPGRPACSLVTKLIVTPALLGNHKGGNNTSLNGWGRDVPFSRTLIR